ncbi:ATPase [Thermoleophilia bacterium SCSIO 60948]|nr:ATPase [Thermoleophilia bacterium SCSIO 60948]
MNATQNKVRATTPADDQILIEREFDAPKDLVWRAYTEADLIRKWWHGGRGEMTVCEMDASVGGKYRFAMNAQGPEGEMEVAFTGVTTELVEGEKIVAVERFEGYPGPQGPNGDGAVNTLTFEDLGEGRTKLTLLMEVSGKEERDMILGSGMADGIEDSFGLLEQTANELA